MVVVTPTIALFVFIAVLLVAIFIAWRSDPQNYDQSRAHVFIGTLAGLGIFITFLFYYSVVGLQQQQQRLSVLEETGNISTVLLASFQAEIKSAVRIAPQFAFSLTPLLPCAQAYDSPDICSPEQCMEIYLLSYKIFDLWQNVVLSYSFIDITPLALAANFLQWANSPYLYEQWVIYKIDFNYATQQYGDLLFEYGLKVSPQTSAAYEAAAQAFISDPRYGLIGFS